MKNAKELLLEFIDLSLRIPAEAAAMFAEDGVFEMPYLEDFGHATRYVGRKDIEGFFQFVIELYPTFKLDNLKVLIETPEQVFAEYEFMGRSSKTGRMIHQLFFGRLVAENGKIKLLREALNSAQLAKAVFAQGIPDLPAEL